ncbi:unnamed protein product [Sphagnum balticum]
MDAERVKAPDRYDPATDKGVQCYSKEYIEALRQAICLVAQPLITEPTVRGVEEVLFNKEPFHRHNSYSELRWSTRLARCWRNGQRWCTTVAGGGRQSRPSILTGRGSQRGGGEGDWRAPGVIARTNTAQAFDLKKAEHASAKFKDKFTPSFARGLRCTGTITTASGGGASSTVGGGKKGRSKHNETERNGMKI